MVDHTNVVINYTVVVIGHTMVKLKAPKVIRDYKISKLIVFAHIMVNFIKANLKFV